MKNIAVIILLTLTVFMFSACTHRLADFTIISSKNIDLSELGKYRRADSRVEGVDRVHIIIAFPTKLFGIPNLKEAVDRAIESVPGAVALVDGVLYYTQFYIPLIYGQNNYTIVGTPLIKPSELSKLPSKNIVVHFDEKTDKFLPSYLNDVDYTELRKKMVVADNNFQKIKSKNNEIKYLKAMP